MYRDLTRDILTPSLLKRLWRSILLDDDDSCWEWQGTRTPPGYGRISISDPETGTSRGEYVHRIVLLATHDLDIPAGMVVMHSCDNPPCCNPKHIKLATYQENAQDRERKGRRRPSTTGRLLVEEPWWQEAIACYRSGESMRSIAKRFGVGRWLVRIVIERSGVEIVAATPSSRFRGVSFDQQTQKWRATIGVNGKAHSIGRFDSEEDAARAYDAYAARVRRECAA